MELQEYVRKTAILSGQKLEKFIADDHGNKYETRIVFNDIKEALDQFLDGKTAKRIFILPGLRGTGKTTLLAQTYFYLLTKVKENQIIYLSVDELKKLLGENLSDFINAYESFNQYLEETELKLFFLIDEIHYDENWAATLKTIYDKSKNIFALATGSSSLALQTSPDLTRRAFTIKIPPLTFNEYLFLKYKKQYKSNNLITDIVTSNSCSELFTRIKAYEKDIRKLLLEINPREINYYLKTGSLPFAFELEESDAYQQTFRVVDKVINEDLPKTGTLSKPILDKAWNLLSLISESESLNYEKMTGRLGIARATLKQLLDSLLKAEIITAIKPYGSAGKMIRKSIKYLFTSSLIRSSILFDLGRNLNNENILGRLLEEAVALYFVLSSYKNKFSIYYDSEKGGADFILINKKDNSRVVVEIGYGEKGAKQVLKTSRKVNAKYGVIISENQFSLDAENKIVYIPKEYFLVSS